MVRPARHCFGLVVAFGIVLSAAAQESPPAATTTDNDAPRRDRGVSSRSARLISASLPKYETKPDGEAGDKPAATIPRVLDRPANGIVRLPDYIVREPKLPNAEQVLSRKGLADYAMKKYLGPSDGFDRGLLNAITFPELAKKVPFIGFLFLLIPSMTNEDRALMYYYQDKRLQEMKYLTELASLPGPRGGAAQNDRTKREIQKAFMHESELGR